MSLVMNLGPHNVRGEKVENLIFHQDDFDMCPMANGSHHLYFSLIIKKKKV